MSGASVSSSICLLLGMLDDTDAVHIFISFGAPISFISSPLIYLGLWSPLSVRRTSLTPWISLYFPYLHLSPSRSSLYLSGTWIPLL
ncbi:hypothetical protein FB45DRAFT_399607 [Roridomyces roridus]|uniref:Uncharacterized protein n=1 Tax=Roridomyces roridus TaxID=1738132 RepID=A0AAD7C3L0_9AGAR|nr:hypothetical protein FB45DRAFT_399607 [Roridomyces roridus]